MAEKLAASPPSEVFTFLSGSLDAEARGKLYEVVLASGTEAQQPLPTSSEALKTEAREKLGAMESEGTLQQKLDSLKGGVDMDGLRSQAREVLKEACESGHLQNALKGLTFEAELDSLRVKARDCLVTAIGEGNLESALEQVKAETSKKSGTWHH